LPDRKATSFIDSTEKRYVVENGRKGAGLCAHDTDLMLLIYKFDFSILSDPVIERWHTVKKDKTQIKRVS